MKVDKLDGKWTLVTGAGEGIGRAIALEAACRGSNVAICDINTARLRETHSALRKQGVEVISGEVDVARVSEVRRFAREVHARVEAIDILVNNAGVALVADILDTSVGDWKHLLGVNLMGVIHVCDTFCPRMLQAGNGGHVVNIASMEGFAALEGMGAYSTSKFAVVGYSESLRLELDQHGIGVSVICPGVIRTSLTADMRARGRYAGDVVERIHSEHEKSGFGPDKVAAAVFQAIRLNVPLRPVAPEAWITYYANRLSPGLTNFILQQVAHRLLKN